MAIRLSLRKPRSTAATSTLTSSSHRTTSVSNSMLGNDNPLIPDTLREIGRLSRLARLGAAWNESTDEERSELRTLTSQK